MNAAITVTTIASFGSGTRRLVTAFVVGLLGLLMVPLLLSSTPTTNSLAMAGVPPGLVQDALQASQLTGIDAAVLVAIARKETNLGQARTEQPDELVPADIRANVDAAALRPGG